MNGHVTDRSERLRLPDPLRLILALTSALNLAGAFWIIPDRGWDFHTFYASAQAWAAGGTPYSLDPSFSPNLTPPWMLLVFWPFTGFSWHTALAIWTCLSLVALWLSLPTLARRTGLSPLDLGLLAIGLTPGALLLRLGQIGFWLLLMFTLAWDAQHRRKDIAAGAWIGVLCAAKPFYGLFVLWFAYRRQWRSLVAAGAVGFAALAVSLAIGGLETAHAWIVALQHIDWEGHLYNASISGIGARLFGLTDHLGEAHWTPIVVSPLLASVTTNALRVLVAGATAYALSDKDDVDAAFATLSMAGLLLSPLAWVHYIPASLGPLVVVLLGAQRRLAASAVALALLPYPAVVNHAYGLLGTLTVGSWATALAGLLWWTASEVGLAGETDKVRRWLPSGKPQPTARLANASRRGSMKSAG